jgi:tetratricopeptide (TPR) repeat protein
VYYKDSSFLPVADALVQVQRKYLVNGSFITVEQPKTDDDGQTLVHLELNEVIYNFVIVKNGEVISTFENRLAYCPNPTFTDCEIFLNEYSSNSAVTDFTTISGLAFDLDFNRTTRDITLLFSVLSGSPATVLLNVTLNDNFGNTTICTDSVTSSSGTITCNVPAGFGNTSVIADIYYKKWEYAKAEADYKQILEANGEDRGVCEKAVRGLVDVYAALKQPEKAKIVLQQAYILFRQQTNMATYEKVMQFLQQLGG